nr:MAG: putative RNA-dependent RNA polymerase [Narnaviridae sp.]
MNKFTQKTRWTVKDLTVASNKHSCSFAPKPVGLYCAARMECVGDNDPKGVSFCPVNMRNSQHFVRRVREEVLNTLLLDGLGDLSSPAGAARPPQGKRDGNWSKNYKNKKSTGSPSVSPRHPANPSLIREHSSLDATRSQPIRLSPDLVQILDSLILPFVARKSLSKEWFSKIEHRRFVLSLARTARELARYESEDNKEQSFLKFHLDSFLGRVFKDKTPPPRPEWLKTSLFSGWCLRFVQRAIARRDVSFIYSLQKGSKRAWPQLGLVKYKEALEKHAQRLSSNHGFLPADLEYSIQGTSELIFRDLKSSSGSKFLPSNSSCLQATRENGGALSLFEKFELRNHLESKTAKIIGKLPALHHSIGEWRQESWKFAVRETIRNMQPDSEGYFPALDVSVMAIPEPSKFRIITKGDGFLYTALQPLQGEMLACWKKSEHSTMRDDDLTQRVQSMHDVLPDVPLWCSVDYEAATDLLKRDATMAVLRRMIEKHELGELAWLTSFAGRATYPKEMREEGKVKVVIAGDGQLMGHPLSFPILCVINLAVYRCALRRWIAAGETRVQRIFRRILSRRLEKQVITNGDDMLFKCFPSFYDIFIRTAADAGFKISAGKNYLSPDMCMINSQVFHIRGQNVKRCGYLNQKFVMGTSLKDGDSKCLPTQVARDLEKMIDLVPWTRCTVPQTMSRWKDQAFGGRFTPNWYVPVCLGGYGLNPDTCGPGKQNVTITRNQRLVAAMFKHNPRLALFRKLGFNLPVGLIQHAIPNTKLVTTSGPFPEGVVVGEDIADDWVARLAYAYQASQSATQSEESVLLYKMKPEFRLSPMNIETIWEHQNAYFIANNTPICPPISQIRFPGFITQNHIWQDERPAWL